MIARSPQLAGQNDASRRRSLAAAGAVAVAALAMGWPSLTGAFLGGDDVQLARDHVLVNHPSLAHATELFSIVHRDLYQPVALLSFSFDFLIAKLLGIAPDHVAVVFHATNLLVHALNAVLVWALVARWSGRLAAGTAAGVLFALHPLNVETVAWISGRMMLLSTLFVLAAVLTMDRWTHRGGWWRAGLVIAFAALGMMSKVRVSLPALMLVIPLVHTQKPKGRWWLPWGGVAAVTGLFFWINLGASSGMLARGEATLQGPRLVRTILALGWYLSRTVAPTGLSPYHPTAELVTWSQPGLLGAGLVVLVALGATAWSARRTRVGWLGMGWFLAAVAVTLPLVPSRNLTVAERYTYLANIGLYWIAGAAFVHLSGKLAGRVGRPATLGIAGIVAAGLVLGMLATSWTTCGYYQSDLARASRIAALYPQYPGTGVRLAWALYGKGAYAKALAAAEGDLARHGPAVEAEACEALGAIRHRQGDAGSAIAMLRRAIAADPLAGGAYVRLAAVYEESGDSAGAVTALERCADLLPNYNPGLAKLAELYRKAGRQDAARRVYAQVLDNNRFDVPATLALAELDIAQEHYRDALARLAQLLAWMPENVPARINAGVCHEKLGEMELARAAYEDARKLDPDAKAAVLNLASLLLADGRTKEAYACLADFLERHPTDRDVLELACAGAGSPTALAAAAALLVRAIEIEPNAVDLRGRYAWLSSLAGRWEAAETQAAAALKLDPAEPRARIARCIAALRAAAPEHAAALAQSLLDDGTLLNPALFDAFAGAVQSYTRAYPDDPWPYFILGVTCAATGRHDAARLAAEEFNRRSHDSAARERLSKVIQTQRARKP